MEFENPILQQETWVSEFLVTRVLFHLHMTSLQKQTSTHRKKNKQNQLTIKLVFWIGGYGVGNPRPSFFLVRKNYTKTFSVPKSAPSEVNLPGGPTCNITGRNSSPLSTCKGAAAMVTSAEKTCRQADKGRTPFHWKKQKKQGSQSLRPTQIMSGWLFCALKLDPWVMV